MVSLDHFKRNWNRKNKWQANQIKIIEVLMQKQEITDKTIKRDLYMWAFQRMLNEISIFLKLITTPSAR